MGIKQPKSYPECIHMHLWYFNIIVLSILTRWYTGHKEIKSNTMLRTKFLRKGNTICFSFDSNKITVIILIHSFLYAYFKRTLKNPFRQAYLIMY